MKRWLITLSFLVPSLGFSANWPNTLSSDSNLFIAVNNCVTALNGDITATTGTVTVDDTSCFPTVGYFTVDNEAIYYTSKDFTHFYGCVRGSDGTSNLTHTNNTLVYHAVIAAHHNVLKNELIAMSTYFLEGDQIHIDTTNARVGISSAAPVSALGVEGTVTATAFSGDGSALANLDADNLASGTVPNERIDTSSITKMGNTFNIANKLLQLDSNADLPADVTASSITLASMYGSPTLDGTNFTELPGAQVGAGVPAANIASGSLGAGVIASSIAVSSVYDSSIIGMAATKLTGTIANERIDSSSITKMGNSFNGINELVQLNASALLANSIIDSSSITKVGPTIEMTELNATGTAEFGKYLQGDGSWSTPAGDGGVAASDNVHWTGINTWESSATFNNTALEIDSPTFVVYDGTVTIPNLSVGKIIFTDDTIQVTSATATGGGTGDVALASTQTFTGGNQFNSWTVHGGSTTTNGVAKFNGVVGINTAPNANYALDVMSTAEGFPYTAGAIRFYNGEATGDGAINVIVSGDAANSSAMYFSVGENGHPQYPTPTIYATGSGVSSLNLSAGLGAISISTNGQTTIGLKITTSEDSVLGISDGWGEYQTKTNLFRAEPYGASVPSFVISTQSMVGISSATPTYPLTVTGYVYTSSGVVFPDGTIQVTSAPASGGGGGDVYLASTQTFSGLNTFNKLITGSSMTLTATTDPALRFSGAGPYQNYPILFESYDGVPNFGNYWISVARSDNPGVPSSAFGFEFAGHDPPVFAVDQDADGTPEATISSHTFSLIGGMVTVASTTFNGVEWTYPSSQGGAGTYLKNNGSGALTWDSPAGSGDAVLASTQVWTGVNTFQSSTTLNGLVGISSHVVITSSETVNALKIVANGTYGTTPASSGGLFVDCTGGGAASGYCTNIYSNAGAQGALGGLLNIKADNTAFNEPLLYLVTDGTSGGATNIRMDGPAPQIEFIENDQSTPAGKYEIGTNGDFFYISGRNAADDSFEDLIKFGRKGIAGGGPYVNLYSTGAFKFYDANSSNFVGFKASDTISANVTWVLPAADGSDGQVLKTNGTGVLTWGMAAGTGDAVLSATQTWTGGNTYQSWSVFTGTVTASTVTVQAIVGSGSGPASFVSGTSSATFGVSTDEDTFVLYDGWGTFDGTQIATTSWMVPAAQVAAGSLGASVIASSVAVDAVGIEQLSASGSPSGTTFLRGDNSWAAPSGSGDAVLAATQTWSGGNTFNSWTTHNGTTSFNASVSIAGPSFITSTQTALGLSVNGTTTYIYTSSATINGVQIATVNWSVPIANIGASGTPSASTYLRGDATWATVAAGGSSTLAVATGTSTGFTGTVSSPTAVLNFNSSQFIGALAGSATAYLRLDPSSATLLGPSIDISGAEATGDLPAARVAAGSLGSGVIGSSLTVSAFYNDSTIRTNLGLAIGSDVQGFDATLSDLASAPLGEDNSVSAGAIAAGTLPSDVIASSLTVSAFWSDATIRSNLGLAIGSDVQGFDATLSDLASAPLGEDNSVSVGAIAAGTLPTDVMASSVAAQSVYASALASTDSPSDGEVPKYDLASGKIAWSADATAAGGGDDLGNHIATTTLNMANFAIINSSGIATTGPSLIISTQSSMNFRVDTATWTFYVSSTNIIIPPANILAGSLDTDVIASSITLAAMYGAPTLVGTNFTSLPGAQVGSGVPAANIASGNLGAEVISLSTQSFTVSISSDASWDSEAYPIWQNKQKAVTIQSVHAAIMSGTSLTYNIEERSEGSITSAGTDIYSSDQAADTTGEIETSFSNASIDAFDHLVLTTGSSAASGEVSVFTVTVIYTVDP